MKSFRICSGKKTRRGGFSLVETTFSIGVMSCGILVLAPLLALGLKTSRLARDDRSSAQIAQTLMEEARQGTLAAGTIYLDEQGNSSVQAQAAYTVQQASVPLGGSVFRLTLRVTPVGAPDRARIYAVVMQAPQ
jgi:type II secretory pathway pseudopilin PulG